MSTNFIAPIKLITKDDVTITVERSVIEMSTLIKDMLEDHSPEEETPLIPLPNIDYKTMNKVIEYMKYHYDKEWEEIEKPLKQKLEDTFCEFDLKFLEITVSELIDLIMAANYLNDKRLLDTTCARCAFYIKGKTVEQIRETFGIENDFSPEEEEKIKSENDWCE